MPDASLARKMKRKARQRAAIINPPAGYEAASFPDFERAATALNGSFDWVQIFVRSQSELKKLAPKAAKALNPDSILWISFPKGTSKIQTDLTRDRGWEAVASLGLKWITLIAVNETWSAFGFRPYRSSEKRD